MKAPSLTSSPANPSVYLSGQSALERLAAIVTGSDDAIIGKDLNGIITSWNLGAEKIFGYTSQEVIGKTIDFLVPNGHSEEELLALSRILKGERANHFVVDQICKDGRKITVSINASPILDQGGKVVGVSRIARDITKAMQNQLALIQANKTLIFQNEEKAKRAAELVIANEEKAKRLDELIIANKELIFQNEEKAKRADELEIANEEKVKLEAVNNKKLHLSLMETIGIARELVEMRDPYTAGHEQNVGDLAKAIGAEMGLDENFQLGLMIAGYLHDIGKIIIPEEILCKPGRISLEEFNLIKNHVQAGFELLKNVNFPWDISRSVIEHHERLDGSGYPNGLKGNQISLEGRIMAVADVVDAMSAFRPYRQALGIVPALSEIERGRGTIYDEKVVDACLTLFREKDYKIASSLH